MNQMAPKASSTEMGFGAGLAAIRAEGDGSSIPGAEVSIATWAGSFSTDILIPVRIDNHERSVDSMNREMRRQTIGCHIGHPGAHWQAGSLKIKGRESLVWWCET